MPIKSSEQIVITQCPPEGLMIHQHADIKIIRYINAIQPYSLLSVSGPQHNKTVVCYISTWAVYRPDRGSFNIDNFDPNLCTIAIYAFAGLDPVNDAIRSLGKLPLITRLIRFRSIQSMIVYFENRQKIMNFQRTGAGENFC